MSRRKEKLLTSVLMGRAAERTDGICYNCNGNQYVFPGMPGNPTMLDTSRVIKCPVCDGTGKRDSQLRLFT